MVPAHLICMINYRYLIDFQAFCRVVICISHGQNKNWFCTRLFDTYWSKEGFVYGMMESTDWIATHSCLSYSYINFMANFFSIHLICVSRTLNVCIYVTRFSFLYVFLLYFSNRFRNDWGTSELSVWAQSNTRNNILDEQFMKMKYANS